MQPKLCSSLPLTRLCIERQALKNLDVFNDVQVNFDTSDTGVGQ